MGGVERPGDGGAYKTTKGLEIPAEDNGGVGEQGRVRVSYRRPQGCASGENTPCGQRCEKEALQNEGKEKLRRGKRGAPKPSPSKRNEGSRWG